MRYLVDEAALPSFANCEPLGDVLRTFANTVFDLRRSGETVGLTAGWASLPAAGTDLGGFLGAVGPADRDAARLATIALDQCSGWDKDPEIDLDPYVDLDGEPCESYAVAYAAALAENGCVAGCITVRNCHPVGVHRVARTGERPVDIAFVVDAQDGRIVHRLRYAVESVAERDFFVVAARAFPNLVFADNVSFRRFDGSYADLRDRVVKHLSALDDGFKRVYAAANGNLRFASTELGIAISIEGGTRASPKLMAQRDARYNGRTYRCEIHSKIEPHRNRIHFNPGDEHSDGRLVSRV